MDMYKEFCIYCGSDSIVPLDEDNWLEHNCHILQCQRCKAMFTELELKFEADRSVLDSHPGFDINDEEATLEAVKEAWHSRRHTKANQTLEWLFQHKYPLQHPLEFMIYRDFWQLNDALNSRSILDETKNYDHIYTCGRLLDLLINNLQNIDYFLPSYSSGDKITMMRRLSDILRLLPAQTIEVNKLPAPQQDSFVQTIMQKRTSALTACAEQAESLYDSTHSLDYLKTAALLLAQCLGRTAVFNSSLSPKNPDYVRYLLLPEKQYSLISKHLADIISVIRQTEPTFNAQTPATSWYKLHPYLFSFTLIFSIAVIILLLSYLDSIIFISDGMLAVMLITGVFAFGAAIVFGIIFLEKRYLPSGSETKKENDKRQQLRKRICGNGD